jgi:hypothetical protein
MEIFGNRFSVVGRVTSRGKIAWKAAASGDAAYRKNQEVP